MINQQNAIPASSVRPTIVLCRAFLTANQTITGTTGATIVFDEEDAREGFVVSESASETGWLDTATGKITPPFKGMYRVTCKAQWASSSDTNARSILVQINGTDFDNQIDLNVGTAGQLRQRIVTGSFEMNGDEDYITVIAKEQATGTQDVEGNATGTYTWVEVELVRRIDKLKG